MNKILVVDDEQDICEILQYNLETEGYEVVTANSAEEALTLPLSEFSLLLLDVMMGEMSGFEMAMKMKDDPALSQIPIIFITALDTEDDIVKGLNIGADDYIAKPLSMKEVKARVAAVLRRNKVVQPVADQIVRHQRDLIRHEHQNHIEEENAVTHLAAPAREAVGGDGCHQKLREHDRHDQNHRVPELVQEIRAFEQHRKIL